MNEEWRPVKGYEGLYEVSNTGKVKSIERYVDVINNGTLCKRIIKERILKEIINSNGYGVVNLFIDGKAKIRTIHGLVSQTFIGERQKGMCACHKDSNQRNNCLENIRYDSQKNNCYDKYNNGTWQHGEKIGSHKLTEEQVEEIIELISETSIAYKEIAQMYNVNTSTVQRINSGTLWHDYFLEYPIRTIKIYNCSKRKTPPITE